MEVNHSELGNTALRLRVVHEYGHESYSEKDIANIPFKGPGTDEYRETLYVNDVAVMDGDYYHDKIGYKVEGFIEALKLLNIKIVMEDEMYIPYQNKHLTDWDLQAVVMPDWNSRFE